MPNNNKGQKMNTPQTESETAEVKPATKTIYVNIEFTKLANDINGGALAHQFNGKGRKVALLPEELEANYLNYSSDKAGKDILTQPFVITNGENIKFKLQAAPNDCSNASYKWKGIIQNSFDLRLVSEKSKKHSATYNAVATEGTGTDDVIIHINFKLDGDKFSAAWDPRVKVIKL
jgi:hypothetical protein